MILNAGYSVRKMMKSRQGFIGGSDVRSILRQEYYELWLVKTGRVSSEDLSDVLAVQMGITTEDLNLQWFSKKTGKLVSRQQETFCSDNYGVPFKGTIDGFIESDNCIVEAKHTNPNSNFDKLLWYYKPQIQLYCGLSGASGGYLTVFFGSNIWDYCYVPFDQSAFDAIVSASKDFWWYVANDFPPENYEDLWLK
jgi:hypothetical protein